MRAFTAYDDRPIRRASEDLTVTHREVYSVACPKCGRARGSSCETPTGFFASPHKHRIAEAEAAKAAGTLAVLSHS